MASLVFTYAHADEGLRNELEKHLSPLKRMGRISTWHDRRIVPGEEFAGQIDQLRSAFGAANEGKRLLALPCLAPLLPPKPRRRWVWLRSKTAPGHAGIIL